MDYKSELKKAWWKESIIYQIYPRSFNDRNNDGIGDIPGIIEKLDYIKSLGVDIIWICPVYQSPNDDNGYDISDYYEIMPEFGTMSDFDNLLSLVHQKGMKLIMDLVVNHTSDEHSWFQESRSSRENNKRDFYIWRDPKDGKEPNNWLSFFGGKAWELDQKTGQYYLHLFTKKQPDLNWENRELRNEIYKMMHFWLQKGIDGFRMDVISLISKRDFIDVPVQGFNETIQTVYANGPKVHEYLNEMNGNVLKHYDILTVGEGPGITLSEGPKYVNASRKELNMIFHFDHMFIDHGPGGKFDPVRYDLIHFKDVFEQWDLVLKEEGWSSIFLGNHDFPRIVSRFGNDDEFHSESAKAIALLLLTHRGTTYIYQGDEIGMTNVSFPSIEEYRDVETLNAYKEAVKSGREVNDFLKAVHIQGRDNARTPVQWTNEENAGFSTKKPWINVNPNYTEINVEIQEKDPDSILNFYRKMIQYRKSHDTLIYGDYKIIDKLNPRVFAYERAHNNDQYFIMINFSDEKTPFSTLDRDYIDIKKVEISNYNSIPEIESGNIILKPWEALIFKK